MNEYQVTISYKLQATSIGRAVEKSIDRAASFGDVELDVCGQDEKHYIHIVTADPRPRGLKKAIRNLARAMGAS